MLIGPSCINFIEIQIKIKQFSFKRMNLKMSAKWPSFCLSLNVLIHWGRVTHICVTKLTIIASDNGLSPGILLIGPLGTNFSEIWFEIHTWSFHELHLKMSSGKWRPCWIIPLYTHNNNFTNNSGQLLSEYLSASAVTEINYPQEQMYLHLR